MDWVFLPSFISADIYKAIDNSLITREDIKKKFKNKSKLVVTTLKKLRYEDIREEF